MGILIRKDNNDTLINDFIKLPFNKSLKYIKLKLIKYEYIKPKLYIKYGFINKLIVIINIRILYDFIFNFNLLFILQNIYINTDLITETK